MKVLMSAYACEPDKGSEPGIGWHWVEEVTRLGHQVWAFTRANNRDAIERVSPRLANLHIVYHELPEWLVYLKKKGPFLRLYYALWQWTAYRRAVQLHQQERFDLVHHITFGSFRDASFMGRLGIPFIFGPVGGGERAPMRLRMDYGVKGHVLDALRDFANTASRWNPLLRETLTAARVIFVTSHETGAALPARYQHKVRQQFVIGAPQVADSPSPIVDDRGIRFLFAGRFLYWKGMQYGLRAFARFVHAVPNARLALVGAGPEGEKWQRLAVKLGIGHAVEWHEWIHHADVATMYRRHDVFLFPSLHDSSGMVVLEAMSFGLPVVCFDLGGPGLLVTDQSGIVIRTTDRNHGQLIAALAETMHALVDQPDRLRELQRGALARAREMTWAAAARRVYEMSPGSE